ncbi:MAG: hypothetical protein JXA07_03715 [Spirochaetes bacterium]|nr:hypothetical protein [Spirochaetota bacterium]
MKKTTLKKILSIISVFILGLGSLGCNGKVFSALLDKDNIPLFTMIAMNAGPRVSLTSTPLINIDNVGSYTVSGTCSEDGRDVVVTVSDGTVTASATTVCTAESFTADTWTPAVSGLDDSQTILITADHTNEKGKAARQATATVVKDTGAPGVTITSTATNPTDQAIPVTITFSESVTGFEVGDITVGNGTAGSFLGSGTTYTAVITPSAQGAVTVDINAGVAQDAAGNPNTAAAQFSRTYDTTNLLVSISSTASDPTNAAIPITITFSRSVTGFESTEIVVGNGSVAGGSFGGSGAVYTATINPTDQGEVTVDVNAGVAIDVLSNTNIAATQFSITYDSIPPAVSIGSPSDTLINSGGSTTYTLTYDEAPTGLDSGDINVQGTGVTCSTITIEDETTTMPDVTVSGCTGDGTFYITVDAGTSQDAAGNADLGDSTSDSVTVDNTPPRISSVETAKADGTYPVGEVINIVVEFNETVTLAGGTLNLELNSGGTLNIPAFSDSSTDMDYTVAAGEATPVSTPLDSSGISLGTGATLVDAAGNAISNFTPLSNISSASTIYIDGVLPAITSAETMDADVDGKIDHYRVTFNRNINDSSFVTGQWDVAGYTITGLDTSSAAPISDTGDDNILYIAFTELAGTTGDTGAKPDLTTPGTLTLEDFRGNPMVPIPDLDDVIEIDGAAPVIMRATGRTGVDDLSIEFSEQVDANGSIGGCPGGDGNDLTTASFVYDDNSGDGAGSLDSMGGDVTACSGSGIYTVSAVLNVEMEATDLSAPDYVAPAANAIRDMGDNWADSGRQVAITGAVSPYVYDVYANLKQKIRVAFSEPVDNSVATNATSALNHANYSLAENPVESGCSAGGGGADTVNIDTATPIVDVNGDGTVFELTTTAAQCGSTTYELTVSQAIIDQDDSVELVEPYIMTFPGNEQLRVVSGSNLTISTMVVVFNKAVEAGTGDGGAELATRYKFNNTTAGTLATSAVRGTGSNVNRVTLGTDFFQKARTYMVIGANGDDLYGFTEGGVGAIKTTTVVSEGAESPQESLQAYPRDRAPWVGYGTPILNLDDGPLAEDPFADTSTFGYLASYSGKVYIGPNNLGNATSRMEPDASNPEVAYFQFQKDTTGSTGDEGETSQSSNDDTSRDGGIAVPPYVTIGHSGCTADTAELNTGCGPDNEDGRGVFSSGTIGSTEYIFLGGARTTADGDGDYWFDYVYYTSGTGDILNFNYVDMGNITGTVTSGLSSNLLFNSRLQVGMAKYNTNAPDFGKINFSTGSAQGDCTPGANCDATAGTYGDRYFINCIDYFGGVDQSGTQNTYTNWAYYVGVDAMYNFRGRFYAANGGHNSQNHDGGVIRSDGANYANPGRCPYDDVYNGPGDSTFNTCTGGANRCPDWLEIAPRSQQEWYNTDDTTPRFSLELTKTADLIPADKATPAFAEYEGKLYMIRNTCRTAATGSGVDSSLHYTTGCTAASYTYTSTEFQNRQPQLWVCTPETTGDADECDAGDWALVDNASSPDGVTNFGDANNHSITMVMKSGKYLYVGLDNVNGIQVYRVKTVAGVPIAEPTEDDFDRIGTGVPGIDGTMYKEIYSAITIPGTGIYSNYSFMYLSAGKNSTPVAIFIEMGGNTAAYE